MESSFLFLLLFLISGQSLFLPFFLCRRQSSFPLPSSWVPSPQEQEDLLHHFMPLCCCLHCLLIDLLLPLLLINHKPSCDQSGKSSPHASFPTPPTTYLPNDGGDLLPLIGSIIPIPIMCKPDYGGTLFPFCGFPETFPNRSFLQCHLSSPHLYLYSPSEGRTGFFSPTLPPSPPRISPRM